MVCVSCSHGICSRVNAAKPRMADACKRDMTRSGVERRQHNKQDILEEEANQQLYRRPPDVGTSQGRRRVNAAYVLVNPGLQCLQAEELPKLLVHKLGHLGVKASQYQTRTCPCQRFPR